MNKKLHEEVVGGSGGGVTNFTLFKGFPLNSCLYLYLSISVYLLPISTNIIFYQAHWW